ncbi:hypothetical protein VKT23_015850 [Stygiomarasmius scandens]|uniref:Uncharacterized protein n=1 Tax=Marasmiellus scandens TaxID=2682957 RepID=A0ABR1IWN4_9AGAR
MPPSSESELLLSGSKRAYEQENFGESDSDARFKPRPRVHDEATYSDQVAELAKAELEKALKSYYASEETFSRCVIESLTRSETSDNLVERFKFLDLSSTERKDGRLDTFFTNDSDVVEEFLVLDDQCVVVRISECLPSLEYESCTPVMASILVEDDSDYMPFIPFADDPWFNYESHVQRYKYSAWQHLWRPGYTDLQAIAFDAACRLHKDCGISFVDMDKTGVFPFPLLNSTETPGLPSQTSKQ